jgi:TonB family protein
MLVVVLGASRQAQATGGPSEPPAQKAPATSSSRETLPALQADTTTHPGVDADIPSFGAGMTRPERLSGPIPQYTKEALEKRSQGLMIVKCIITVEGEVRKCRIIKPLPFMEEAVLDALYQSRYKPVTFEGKPIQVDYTFNIKLALPEPAQEG